MPISRGLLAESAQIVLQNTGEATASARALAKQWHEQSVLDPRAAEHTALKLKTELAHAQGVQSIFRVAPLDGGTSHQDEPRGFLAIPYLRV
jgi:hypothetical protein